METQINAISRVEYRGLNQDELLITAIRNEYKSNEWVTFLQARKLNKNVRKGEHGVRLVRVFRVEKKKGGNVVKENAVRSFVVFNLEQLEDAVA